MNPIDPNTNRMEEALKGALRRQEAPEGFADRVLARVMERPPVRHEVARNPWGTIFFQPLLRWAAFAAICVSLTVGAIHHHNVMRERAEGEAAKQRLMLALRIAGSKLQLAKTKVNEINEPPNRHRNEPVKE